MSSEDLDLPKIPSSGGSSTNTSEFNTGSNVVGGAATPSIYFKNHLDTGLFYSNSPSGVGISIDGSDKGGVNVEGLYSRKNCLVPGQVLANDTTYLSNATASTPSYSFNGDTETGFYSSGNHSLSLTCNSTQKIEISDYKNTPNINTYPLLNDDAQAYGIIWVEDDSQFVVPIYSGGSSAVLLSSDGINWTGSTSPVVLNAEGIAYAPEISTYVMGGGGVNNYLSYSTDGADTWTSIAVGNGNWRQVAWSGSIFAATSSQGTDRIAYSSDGISWTLVSGFDYCSWRCLEWNGVIFVALGNGGDTTSPVYSTDGINWSNDGSIIEPGSHYEMCWSSDLGIFLAVDLGGNRYFHHSSDGIVWTRMGAFLPEGDQIYDVQWSSEHHIFVALNRDDPHIFTSRNGVDWIGQSSSNACNYRGLGYSPSLQRFCSVCSTGDNRVMTVDFVDGVRMQENLYLPSGSSSSAALGFLGETDTGIYRIGENNIGVTCGGVKQIDISDSKSILTNHMDYNVSNRCYAKYALNDATQSVPTSSNTLMDFGNSIVSDGSGYTFTSNRFTNTSGHTKFYSIRVYTYIGSSIEFIEVYIPPNNNDAVTTKALAGTSIITNMMSASTAASRIQLTTIRKMDTGDYFEVGCYQDSGGAILLSSALSNRYDLYSTLEIVELV